jgi:dienelactone hydrolase
LVIKDDGIQTILSAATKWSDNRFIGSFVSIDAQQDFTILLSFNEAQPKGKPATVTFTYDGKTRTVFRQGTGPAVIVIAEMPGISPKVLEFARRIVAIGCTAVVPHLFGEPGRDADPSTSGRGKLDSGRYLVSSIAPACISREFTVLATGKTSPVIAWLRALARSEHERAGGPGVGAVGMCFTGGFALGMMLDERMLAPVLSQPSLPFPLGKKRKAAVGLSDADLQAVAARAAHGACVMGLRFTKDPAVPDARFATLRDVLGDRFIAVEIDSSRGNPYGFGRTAHSVLTEHFVDEPGNPTVDALNRVLAFFDERLR